MTTAVETVFEEILAGLENGDSIKIAGFGLFEVKTHNALAATASIMLSLFITIFSLIYLHTTTKSGYMQ